MPTRATQIPRRTFDRLSEAGAPGVHILMVRCRGGGQCYILKASDPKVKAITAFAPYSGLKKALLEKCSIELPRLKDINAAMASRNTPSKDYVYFTTNLDEARLL